MSEQERLKEEVLNLIAHTAARANAEAWLDVCACCRRVIDLVTDIQILDCGPPDPDGSVNVYGSS